MGYWDAVLLKGKFCYKIEKTRISLVYRKQGRLSTHAQVTDVRSQLPELVWELEPRTGGGKAGDGTGLRTPGLERMEEAAADSPIRAPSGAQHHQLC